jgi:hypothetical protein
LQAANRQQETVGKLKREMISNILDTNKLENDFKLKQKDILRESITSLLISRGVPADLLFNNSDFHDWKSCENKLIPVTLMRDICLKMGIDQIKNRQNFRNWVQKASSHESIPEGQLSLLRPGEATDILAKCLSRICRIETDTYEGVLTLMARNMLWEVFTRGTFSNIMVSLPPAYRPSEKLARKDKIEQGIVKYVDEKYYLKQAGIPREFFYSADPDTIDFEKLKQNHYVIEHVRDICVFLGLTGAKDKPTLSKWLSKILNIKNLAEAEGLNLLSFDQTVEIIAKTLTRLVEIYSGERVYVTKNNVNEKMFEFARIILWHIGKNSEFGLVLSQLPSEFRPRKRLKGGSYG